MAIKASINENEHNLDYGPCMHNFHFTYSNQEVAQWTKGPSFSCPKNTRIFS
ncbi:hypothetical protein Sjap_007764 [Stephania japonica]|uniref:Uncharacterized protein n=1 Tax=Stephania japonica TaxID=461633 RepID=A0AAP0PDZ9_9MAGN